MMDSPDSRTMDFNEAMTRAKATHTVVRTAHQPGNGYRTEYRCTCGDLVFREHWRQHILDAADQLRSSTLRGSSDG